MELWRISLFLVVSTPAVEMYAPAAAHQPAHDVITSERCSHAAMMRQMMRPAAPEPAGPGYGRGDWAVVVVVVVNSMKSSQLHSSLFALITLKFEELNFNNDMPINSDHLHDGFSSRRGDLHIK